MNETEIEVSSPAYPNMPQWNMSMRFIDGEWRLQCEHVIHDPIVFETFRQYRDAAHAYVQILDKIRACDVTLDTLRMSRCIWYGAYSPWLGYNCDSEVHSDSFRPFATLAPQEEYDKHYCGCRGWEHW